MTVVLTLLAASAPAASAGDAGSPLAIESMEPLAAPIPYGASATVNVTLGVGCLAAAQAATAGQGSAKATVQVENAPVWLAVPPTNVTFDAAGCSTPLGGGYLLANGTVELRVAPQAPGVIPQAANFTATMPVLGGNQSAVPHPYAFNVTYHANYSLVPSFQFPHTMTGSILEFNVTINVTANAPTMVMIEGLNVTAGSVNGLRFDAYDPPQERVFRVTFTAPDTPWNETAVMFHSYSHFFVNDAGLAGHRKLEQDYTWIIRNGNPGDEADAPAGAKESPGSGMFIVALLGAAVAVARRHTWPPRLENLALG